MKEMAIVRGRLYDIGISILASIVAILIAVPFYISIIGCCGTPPPTNSGSTNFSSPPGGNSPTSLSPLNINLGNLPTNTTETGGPGGGGSGGDSR